MEMKELEKLTETSRRYLLNGESVQSLSYAIAEYLDTKKNMVTQTMRIRDGYIVQSKGDLTADWTKYLGLDAAVNIELHQEGDELNVIISSGKWIEKAGIAAAGLFIFQPLLWTAGIGMVRSLALPQDIFNFLNDRLQSIDDTPQRTETPNAKVCPECGAPNKAGARYCSKCGASLERQVRICEGCGQKLDEDELFCPNCGRRAE